MRKVFVSYAHADHAMVARLMIHLRPIERQFGIAFRQYDALRLDRRRHRARVAFFLWAKSFYNVATDSICSTSRNPAEN